MTSTEIDLTGVAETQVKRSSSSNSLTRVLKYSAFKLIALMLTVTVGVYLTVLIANMGG